MEIARINYRLSVSRQNTVFLKTQLYVRTLDEYDFLSYPGFSLEKMKTLSQIFEMGHSVEEVRKRVCQKSTLKSIESLLHDLEQSKAGRYIHTSCSAKNEKQSKAKSKSSTLGCNSADDEKDKETEIRIFIPNHLEMYIALKLLNSSKNEEFSNHSNVRMKILFKW